MSLMSSVISSLTWFLHESKTLITVAKRTGFSSDGNITPFLWLLLIISVSIGDTVHLYQVKAPPAKFRNIYKAKVSREKRAAGLTHGLITIHIYGISIQVKKEKFQILDISGRAIVISKKPFTVWRYGY